MRGTADMSSVKEGFAVLPEGEYTVKIDAIEPGTTQNGDPKFAVKFIICTGEFIGWWVWDNITISENPNSPGFKILWRTKKFLKCIGEPHEGKIEYDTDNWYGCKLKITVFHDMYKGQEKAKVSDFAPINEEGETATKEEEIPF